eukprot:CAMPEP_0202860134 /NCGR_PEP_ID=MMETSP1391-20130828/1970_1 /ASSEMBLY_ACC=CAM_ASM_000867 /TAXON_ID=1034604 /ORGANISM="Chlamydomonas leiostraca, Strain SAG 11-49" /LENGTH=287 /DNA_ID=CAMNT_0049539269 /DNA_START=32 /DNA_END=895 /DNA_ORIENTATION=-
MACLKVGPSTGLTTCSTSRSTLALKPSFNSSSKARIPRALVTRALGGDSTSGKKPVCPVPREQQPVYELAALQDAFMFDWPKLSLPHFAARIAGLWGGAFLFTVPVSAATFSAPDELVQLLSASVIGSGFLVMVVVLRLYIGYSHVGSRLFSATIEYEETGWYDGEIYVKPPEMLTRDRLLGAYQVRPVLDTLKTSLLGLAGVMAVAMVLLVTTPSPRQMAANASTSAPPRAYSSAAAAPAADYWQSVQQYEPWALQEQEQGEDADAPQLQRSSILDHMRKPAPSLQ